MNSQLNQSSASLDLREALVKLSCSELCDVERQALVAQILQNPTAAIEAKLALRLSDQATQMASTLVQRADSIAAHKRSFAWGFGALTGGTCAGLLMFFALPNSQVNSPERAVADFSTQAVVPEQMMSESGFEAPISDFSSDFGGSFE